MPANIKTRDLDFLGIRDKKFNDPFELNSNLYIPKDFYTALEFALYLAIRHPKYREAVRRTVAYFITDITFVGKAGDQKERDEWKDYLVNQLGLLDCLLMCGMEQQIYGNSFLRIHYPFDRFLVDRRNGKFRQYHVSAFGENIKFHLKDMAYEVPDPEAAHLPADKRPTVKLEFIDRKSHDMSRIRLRRLNPLRMRLNMNLMSGTTEYIYQFEEFFRSAVEQGEPIHQINETPMDMLKAIRNNQDFKFRPGTIFHFKEDFISGISFSGWGIPNILLNYSNLHQVQVFRCINEAIGLDYMLPIRLLSPNASPSQGGADQASAIHMGQWRAAINGLMANKRKDPTALHTVPFPVTYQELGANGKQLAPVELLQHAEDQVLDGFGYAAEFWHMSTQYQVLPTAMRMFESTWMHLFRCLGNATRWVSKHILDYLEREQMGVYLMRPSMADDLDLKHIKMSLAAGGEISRATAYRPIGIDDPIEEQKRRQQEDIEIQKAVQKEQENFEREMTLGSGDQVVDAMMQAQQAPPPGAAAPPPGGGMPPGGGGGNVTPLDLQAQAEEQAMQLLQIQDVGERRKQMMQIKATNPTLYALVKEKMDEIREQGASQGRKAVGQPQQ